MRAKVVAGNWKMNNDQAATIALIDALKSKASKAEVSVKIAPATVHLAQAVEALRDSSIEVMAQNMHAAENGAFTGEVSAQMLKSVGVTTTILGHSERRAYFNETDAALSKKVNTALEHDMEVVFCFGEELEDRQSDKHFEVVKQQLQEGLFHIDAAAWDNIILAYEPVWAIGTGETASPAQAQEMHAFIRQTLSDHYGQAVADKVAILYGGSVKPSNAKEIFSKPDVDGGLIGGASLDADDFFAIVDAI